MPVGKRQTAPRGTGRRGAPRRPSDSRRAPPAVDHAHAPRRSCPAALSRSMPTSAAPAPRRTGRRASGPVAERLPSTSRAPRAPVTITIATSPCAGEGGDPPDLEGGRRGRRQQTMRAHAASPRRRVGPRWSQELWILRTLLAEELLDLGDHVREAGARLTGHRDPPSSSSSGFFFSSLVTYSAILAFWATIPFRFCSN